ncbi:MAG: hypothetical protein CMJ49_09355 [Planctomycetaceae bacterium]|nr:hypothetical protein [Planctomycetaceae bacterium]
MEFIRRSLAQVQAQLSQLSVSQKLLISTVMVIIVMALAMVMLYAAQPEMVSLPLETADAQQIIQISALLRASDIPHETRGNKVFVPIDDRSRAMGTLAREQVLPTDTSSSFAEMLDKQDWWHGDKQQDQMWDVAIQDSLGQFIGDMPGVQHGSVIISRPSSAGFSQTHKNPTAAVNVVMNSGKVDQHLADAIAALASGAVAELNAADVAVIDSRAGRLWNVGEEDDYAPGDYLEQVRNHERHYQAKIAQSLSFIRGLIVSVNVELDPDRKETETVTFNKDTSVELLETERATTSNTSDTESAGEAGARPNTALNIAGSGASGSESTSEEREASYVPHAGSMHERVVKVPGLPERVSATVHIPRDYLVARFRRANDDDQAQPDDAALKALADLDFKDKITPLIAAKNPGTVMVGLYAPIDPNAASDAAQSATAGFLAGGYIKYAGLGALVITSLAMMLMMVRKAARPPKLPDPRELAGLPPQPGDDSPIIGDAAQARSALTGMELTDADVRNRQVTEQISAMVNDQPDEVARVLGRWIEREE